MLPSAAELVARFLRANNYTLTLQDFIEEANLPTNVGASAEDSNTIESILHEKKVFDSSLSAEKVSENEEGQGWTLPAPCNDRVITSLPNSSNIISLSVMSLSLSTVIGPRSYVAVTTADRQLYLLDQSTPGLELVHSYSNSQDSPILDIVSIESRYLLLASMSGKLLLYDTLHSRSVDECRDHSKYLVKLATWKDDHSILVASAGWDSRIFLYKLDMTAENPKLGEPIAKLELQSIPETIVGIVSEEGLPILLVARRDSTLLHFFSLPTEDSPGLTYIGRQNLAPHSNHWVGFSPVDVQISPNNPMQVAVATSSTPYMKILVVQLLLPPKEIIPRPAGSGPASAADAAREEARTAVLREEAAILLNVSTRAPQNLYSTPRLAWRTDGSGIFVNSDDGIVRGIETKTGKLVASLEGHLAGSKVRSLASYMSPVNGGSRQSTESRERIISGGFDQRLILWSPT